ncbi:Arc family DNA-binding protein [Pseudomonas sp. NPDC088368]|uniref:Arc family DNA-binding protein n=1 Tax=Pseudomonas sp. NPDC088368 TaxID=3364453 RepID=UPI003819AA4E
MITPQTAMPAYSANSGRGSLHAGEHLALELEACTPLAAQSNGPIDEKFVVRFPVGMRDRIAQRAKQHGRSMNAEIVYRMRSTLDLEDEVLRLKAVIDALLSNASGAVANLAHGKEV